MNIRTGNFNGTLITQGNVSGLDLSHSDGYIDQTDSIYIMKSKAQKHMATSSNPLQYAGHGAHSHVVLDDEEQSRYFITAVFEAFRKAAIQCVTQQNSRLWVCVEFDNVEIVNLVSKRYQGQQWVGIGNYQTMEIGAAVSLDLNGYTFVFNHGPLVR